MFGPTFFRNEIIWQRTTPKGHAFTRFPSTHDVLLAYGRSDEMHWHAQHAPHRPEYIESHYSNIDPKTGRQFMLDNCLNPNPDRPNMMTGRAKPNARCTKKGLYAARAIAGKRALIAKT